MRSTSVVFGGGKTNGVDQASGTMSFPFGTNEYSSLWAFSWGVRTKSVRNVVERIAREGACSQGETKILFGLYGRYVGRARCPHRAETVRKRNFVVWRLRRGEDTAPYRATYHARHLTIFVHTHCKGVNKKCEERS